MALAAEIALLACVRQPTMIAARPLAKRGVVAYLWDTETWLYWNPQAGRNGAWREAGVGALSPVEFAQHLGVHGQDDWELVVIVVVENGA